MTLHDQSYVSASDNDRQSGNALKTLSSAATSRKMADSDYAGDVLPKEVMAFAALHSCVIIDVRTEPEWKYVGQPDITGTQAQLLNLSWMHYPDYALNSRFITELQEKVTDKNTPCFFLCKVGGRSLQAANAAAKAGYSNSFNILHGFEGETDRNGQRGHINGWKAQACAWVQS